MNTQQLELYMLSDPYIREVYGGVVAYDQLPILVVSRPRIFIVNTEPISEPGDHWIVLYFDHNVCEHFDSSGSVPRTTYMPYIFVNSVKFMYNNERLQHYNSDTCGLFCLFYAYFRCRGFLFNQILDMFYDNLLLNEFVVKTFYNLTV